MLENFGGKFGNQYEIKIRGTTFTNSISVSNTIVNIILDDAKIYTQSSFIVDDSTVYLFIYGETNLISSSNDAGIRCSDSFIQIMNATSQEQLKNTLTVSSDKYAGIGGGSSNSNCKGIFIYGGRIIANGGEFGAGIGGGEGLDKIDSAGVNKIEIINGEITSTGGKQGAGIGGGSGKSESSSKIYSIKIYGGKVQANGGEFSSGIGGGYGFSKSSSTVDSIEIIGGEVSAKGGSYGSGIGNGYSSNREASTVNTITLETNRVIENSVDKNVICTTIDATKGEMAKKAIGYGFLEDIASPNIIENGSTISCQKNSSICFFSPSDKKCIKPWKCSSEKIENCPKCNLQNCEHSNVYCECDLCIEGYVSLNGLCVLKNETGENPDSSSCSPKIENCIEFLNGNCHICDRCTPGFTPNFDKSMCIQCSEDFRCRKYKDQCLCETCDSGFSPDPTNNFKCRECSVANCASCESNFTVCQICASGYTLNNDKKCEKCTFSEADQSSFYSCTKFAQNSCVCEKCMSGFALDNGRCVKCTVANCNDCPASKDRCVSCAAGYKVSGKNDSFGGDKCEACNVINCVSYSIGCNCSVCSTGFSLQNGVCEVSQIVNKRSVGVAFCVNESDASLCSDLQNNWENNHRQKLADFAANKMNNPQTHVSERIGYQTMLASVNSIGSIQSAISNGINNFLSDVKENNGNREIIIFQFGSMQQNQFYDFSQLSINHFNIQIFSVSGYLKKNFMNTEIQRIAINGGKLNKVDSISSFFGSLSFSSSIEINQLSLIASSISDDVISIHSKVLIVDSHSIGIINKMNIDTKSFGVVIVESSNLSPSISVTFSDNTYIVKTSTSYDNSVAVSSLIGKEQTMLLTTIKRMEIKIDPSMKSRSINKLLNISFKNEIYQNYNDITISFDQQNEWKNAYFKKGIVFEYQSPGQISIQNKPKNIKIVVNQRNQNGQIEKNDSNNNNNQNSGSPKVSGLSDLIINGIILSFIAASSILILSIFCFFRKKPKKAKKSVKDSSTPLLHQIFIDGF